MSSGRFLPCTLKKLKSLDDREFATDEKPGRGDRDVAIGDRLVYAMISI
jgi:hypothetical protein